MEECSDAAIPSYNFKIISPRKQNILHNFNFSTVSANAEKKLFSEN